MVKTDQFIVFVIEDEIVRRNSDCQAYHIRNDLKVRNRK